ncbi:Metallo-hydrolase/oxidoreductase [Thelephora ganbajun]|uniref:Metallo-hydrolase/oxidoreductase n=1 Tax=Thelephora ganbajun TaxID=370292 RepID=A0ACB6ZT20_THEGA|nr:Metallo-hydrolase/oxidoreductase [Thelephora ganbajun]
MGYKCVCRNLSTSVRTAMKVISIPVRSDNYAYLLIDEESKKAAAVDPYDVPKVASSAQGQGVEIVACITTHHHDDHSGGNHAKEFPNAPIYGGSNQVKAVTEIIKDTDAFTIGSLQVECLATPCHTQDSICYYVTDRSLPGAAPVVFTGDTLFTGGCGRFFEGDGTQMHTALTYLGTLPDSTLVYSGHEYTAGNLSFAKSIDPINKALPRLQELVDSKKITQGYGTIGDEREWNVFMRLDSDAVRKATSGTTVPEIMDELRDMKNNFRG